MDSKREAIVGDSSKELDINANSPFFVKNEVNKGKDCLLKERFKTLIKNKGMSEADFYNSLHISKQYWFCISWGLWNAPVELKLKIAKALDTDSGLIWQESKK